MCISALTQEMNFLDDLRNAKQSRAAKLVKNPWVQPVIVQCRDKWQALLSYIVHITVGFGSLLFFGIYLHVCTMYAAVYTIKRLPRSNWVLGAPICPPHVVEVVGHLRSRSLDLRTPYGHRHWPSGSVREPGDGRGWYHGSVAPAGFRGHLLWLACGWLFCGRCRVRACAARDGLCVQQRLLFLALPLCGGPWPMHLWRDVQHWLSHHVLQGHKGIAVPCSGEVIMVSQRSKLYLRP